MMKYILILSLLCCTFACGTSKKVKKPYNELNGTWIPVKQEINGNLLPKMVFEKQKLIIEDSTYTVIAESVDKGIVQYLGNQMDIYGKEGVNKGKHFTAIYKLENGQLMICYNLKGDSYPETFETKGKATFFMSVFNRE